MENRNDFTIRAYSKKELALIFFPDSAPRTAVNHLMAMIRGCDMLWDELQGMGYYNKRKTFTPREVRAIVEWLGVP
ncbi:MAG: DUF4248 domain-containing protein [Bacteroidales bacterium]|nr:DUF4248 domain-containing protein [Bacteroidales bacterium]